jgi:hypothetical protein
MKVSGKGVFLRGGPFLYHHGPQHAVVILLFLSYYGFRFCFPLAGIDIGGHG